jgi:hypothetical protein
MATVKLYKECPRCKAWVLGWNDHYCPRCGTRLPDERLASINDYAKSLLVEFLENSPKVAKRTLIEEIPAVATENIRADETVLFNRSATCHLIAECWDEVETALDDWREMSGTDYLVHSIEHLHVFAVTQYAEMLWRKIAGDYTDAYLTDESIKEVIERWKA